MMEKTNVLSAERRVQPTDERRTNATWVRWVPGFVRKHFQGRVHLQRMVGNTGWLLADKFVRLAVGLFVSVWLARYLGPADFGTYSYALAFVVLFGVLTSMGLDGVAVREMVRDPQVRDEVLGSAFVLRLIGGLLTVIAASTAVWLLRADDVLTFWLVTVAAMGNVFLAFDVIDLWFQANVQSKYSVYAKNIAFLLVAALKIVLIVQGAPLIAFGVAIFIEAVIGALALTLIYLLRGHSLATWKASFRCAKRLIGSSWPLLISAAAVMMNMQLDRVMLGELLGTAEVGMYAAATRISEVWYFLPVVIGLSVMQALTTAHGMSSLEYQRKLQVVYDLVSLCGLGIAVAVTMGANQLVALLFGPTYHEAGAILQVHIWSTVFVFHVSIRTRSYIVEGLERFVALFAVVATLLNVGLNAVLIPQFGGLGAAYASVFSWLAASLVLPLLGRRTRASSAMFLRSLTFASLRGELRT